MRKTFKIISISIGIIILLMLLLPILFKGKIKDQIQGEINSNLNASVSFGKIGLSFFSHFPDLTLRVKDLIIVGTDEFRQDTLAGIPALSLTINLRSVIRGSEYEVKRIHLDSPRILLKVSKDGKVNWDIVKPSETADSTVSPSNFKVQLKKIMITDADFIYDDAEIPMYFEVNELSGELSGDMTADITNLDIDAMANAVTAEYDGIRYLSAVKAQLVTNLSSDLAKWVFTFKDASLMLNDLHLFAGGYFAMPEDGYDMDISFSAKENTFRSFLSLVPAIFSKEFGSVKTEGTLQFNGFVKGKCTDIQMPSFGLNLKVNDGMFNYPSLPGSVSDIKIDASVTNPDGNADHTVIDVPVFYLKMMQNPVDASFTLKTPISDPEINGKIKATINLADISRIYPLGAKTVLGGLINADIQLKGQLSALDKGEYDQFKASGYASASDVVFSSPDLPQAVKVNSARFDFSPAFISLGGLKMSIGPNDLAAGGRIENYLAYFLQENGVLKGSFSIASTNMDINSLLTESAPATEAGDSLTLGIVEIPGNMDLLLNSQFDRLVYDNYIMQQVSGKLQVKEKTLYINELKADMLGGLVGLRGSYSTIDPKKPDIDLSLDIIKANVKETFRTFNTVQAFAPVAGKLNGDITAKLEFKGALKPDMMPELASISGAGRILSDLLSVDNLNTFNVIADVLKMEKLRKPSIEKVNLSFDLLDGKATIKPMDFKLASYRSTFSGTIGLDQAINFVLNLEIPRSEFGGKANGVLNSMLGEASKKGMNVRLGEVVPVTLLIGGTISDPRVTSGIRQVMADVVEDMKQQALEQVQQKKEELMVKAKEEAGKLIDQANLEAEKIISVARQQSDALLRTAQLSADKVRSQADSAAAKVIAEGKKNGPIAEMAAKKTAEKIKKEADAKANRIFGEARSQSDAILSKAAAEAEQIRQQARNRLK